MGALISYRNRIDTATLSASNVLAGYPLTNLQTRQLAKVCRLDSLGDPTITIDLGAAMRTDVIAALGTNAASAATGNTAISWATSPGGPWTTISGPTANDAAVPDLPRSIIVSHGVDAPVRYWRFKPQWSRVGGAAYFEIGRLWLGPAIMVPEGCASDWGMGFLDRGTLDASGGWQMFEDARPRVPRLRMRFEVETELAYGYTEGATSSTDVPCFQDMQMAAGVTGEVIAAPRASSLLWLRHAGIYGHVESPFEITHLAGQRFGVEFAIVGER